MYKILTEIFNKVLVQLNVDTFVSELFSTRVSNVPLIDYSECNLQYSHALREELGL
jgi:hypothetical protein